MLIFSTPRSGSTLLMEMIAEQPKILPVREPLNLRGDYIRETLGLKHWEEIYSEINYQKVVQYLRSFRFNFLVDARFKREKPFSHTWHPITNRLVYKLLHGMEHKVNDLCRDLNGKAVVLLRHPIPVSLSREELPRFNAFIQSEVASYFTREELELARKTDKNGSVFEKSIVSWCFQNKLLLKNRERHLLVTYEELVMNRGLVIQKIANYFLLPDAEKMVLRSLTPSGSTEKSTIANRELLKSVHKGEVSFLKLINKWVEKVDDDQIDRAQVILDAFGMDIYKAKDIMPSYKYLNFPTEKL